MPLLMVILETGKKLASQLQEAHKMKMKHKLLHAEFSTDFPPDDIQRWTDAIVAWNQDPHNPNPYEDLKSGEQGQMLVITIMTHSL